MRDRPERYLAATADPATADPTLVDLEYQEWSEGKEHIIRGVAVTTKQNRHGDRIKAGAIRLERFLGDNPVMLWSHAWGSPPIGRVLDMQWTPDGIRFEAEFDPKDAFALEIERKYREGWLNMFSIGFRIFKSEPLDEDNDSIFAPRLILDGEMLELSGVIVPADAGAKADREGLCFRSPAQLVAYGLDGADEEELAGSLRSQEPRANWSRRVDRMAHLVRELKNGSPDNPTDLAVLREVATTAARMMDEGASADNSIVQIVLQNLGEAHELDILAELEAEFSSEMPTVVKAKEALERTLELTGRMAQLMSNRVS